MSQTLPTHAPRAAKLGEELPIFCEKCGYSLFGLPPIRCEHCSVMQFHCPECGHHQAVNTLRPAFQKFLGRFRAGIILLAVLFKIWALGMALVGWVAMGVEWTFYHGGYYSPMGRSIRWVPREVDLEQLAAFGMFGLAWGMVARIMLLRWRRGYLVGLALAALACLAVVLGGYIERWDRRISESPLSIGMFECLLVVLLTTTLGAAIVWGIWWALIHTLLPKRTAQSLLAWQEGLSAEVPELAKE